VRVSGFSTKKVTLAPPLARIYPVKSKMPGVAKVAGTVSAVEFAEIVREHQAMVFSIAYHFLHDRAAAEELAQDVFLQLYRRFGELESPGHVTYWLRRVASNRCIDQCRSRKLMPRIGLDQIAEPASPAGQPDPMLRRTLRQLVASLPEKWRVLIVLRYQEDLENEEIARTLGMPVGTVKSQISRALDFLREKASRVLGGTYESL
jgi:RNA polymerase sigma-70 factor (ECF subfamily)